MESKQRTPSVIARLMGLHELSPQQPVCKPHRVLSENYLRKSASIGLLEKRSSHERHSFRVTYEEQQEFIDVFEAPEIPTMDKHYIQSIQEGRTSVSMTEVKMSFVRQNFTDNRLSMDEKHWHSLEFDVVEDLDSNKDLLPRYLQQPDSLFTKHLHDLQFSQSHSQSGHVAVLKSSNTPHSRKNEISRKSERTTARRNILRSLQKLENGFFTDSCGDLVIDYTSQLLNSQMESKNETCFSPSRITKDGTHHSPSRIVVLKPNLGKTDNAAKSLFSPILEDVRSNDRKQVEFSKLKNGKLNNQVVERKILANDMKTSRHSFRVSREFAKGISRQITDSISSSLREVSRTEMRVDETFANESEVMMHSCPSFFDWKNRCQTTNCPLNRSSFAKQAKKQLSQRWKMTRSHQEVRVASRGRTTLGEILAMPDQETRPRKLNYKPDKSGLNNQLSLNDGDADLGSPFGISSRDGWKEEYARSLTRLESLPAASIVTQGKNESMKQNWSRKDSSEAKVSRFSYEKAQTCSCMDSGNDHIIHETCVILKELENKIEKEDFSEKSSAEYGQTVQGTHVIHDELRNICGENNQSGNCEENSIFPYSSISGVASSSLNSEVVAIAETENLGMSYGTPEKQQSEPVACSLFVKDGHSSHVLDASIGQESLTRSQEEALVSSSSLRIDLQSSISLGEGYSPSPNSVLEPPFSEEISSGCECFQGVDADLHGLQMQLQPLKSESEETNSEGHGMVVSSDEDSGDGSVDLSEENRKLVGLFRAEENRDFSYLVDVLDEAGIHGGIKQFNFETWHSPECPVNPSVFEMLEKKYGKQTSWEKSERKFLFDCVNLGLKEILQPFMDVFTWEKPLRKRFKLSQSREVIEEELWMFLCSQEKEKSKDVSEKALGMEVRWIELRDDIDSIVSELESFLFDELSVELANIESF